MRKLALTLVPLLLLACSREPTAPDAAPAPTFAATSDWTDSVLNLPPGDIKFYASCINDMMDEVGPIQGCACQVQPVQVRLAEIGEQEQALAVVVQAPGRIDVRHPHVVGEGLPDDGDVAPDEGVRIVDFVWQQSGDL